MNGAFPVPPEEGHTGRDIVLMAVTLQAHFGQPPTSRDNGRGIAGI